MSGVENLWRLQVISLRRNPLTSLDPLADLQEFSRVDAYLCDSLTDISAVVGKQSMMSLLLHHNQIASLPDMGTMPNLFALVLADNQIVDVSPLSTLNTPGLTIDVGSNAITTGIADLVTLTDISSIDFRYNNSIPSADLDTLEAAIGAEKVIRP